jgi:hypothetical protein
MSKLTVLEVAKRLGVSRSRVQSLLSLGELAGVRETRTIMNIERPVWFIEESAVEAYERAIAEKRAARLPAPYVFPDVNTLTPRRAADLGWLAGIIDGEGYVGLAQRRMTKGKAIWSNFVPTVTVAMNSRPACTRAQEISGVGKLFLKRILNGKEHWCWRARHRDAAVALQSVFPFLVEKRHQVELVLRAARINSSYQAERDWRARLPERAAELKAIAEELINLHGGKHRHL